MVIRMTQRNSFTRREVIWGSCWFAFFGLFFLASCSVGNYAPNAAIAKGVGRNLETFPSPISIENAQESRLEQHLGFLNTVVNYHDFTQSVVDALRNELQAKGTTIVANADKKLSVKVVAVGYCRKV